MKTKTIDKPKTRLGKVEFPMQNQSDLKRLAREIRSRYASAEGLADKAKAGCNAAVAEAILCGESLNRAKGLVGHGEWLKWLKENCKNVHFNTAGRYMRLSKSSHVVNLKDSTSLRQAYIAVGIIAENEPETKPSIITTAGHGVFKTVERAGFDRMDAPAPALPDKPHGEPMNIDDETAKSLGLRPIEDIAKEAGTTTAKQASWEQDKADIEPAVVATIRDLMGLIQRMDVAKAGRYAALLREAKALV